MHAARTRILLPLALALLAPFAAFAALVNINTATADELDALPGIGPSKAAAIVQYRTDHGPFASIQDIQNVSGIGPSTYADIASLITVGDSAPDSSNAPDTTASSSPPASGGASAYVPPPSSLSVDAGPDFSATLDMPLSFSARVKAGSAPDSSARLLWSFGDGSSGEGNPVQKTYQFAGTYLVSVRAQDGLTQAADSIMVTVSAADVRIADATSEGFTLANDSALALDLSGWRLSAGGGTFRFPEGTSIVAHGSVLFPQTITGLPVAFDAELAYPNGIIAARYAPVQPAASATSSSLMQTESPVPATSLSISSHAQDVLAPAPTAALAAGAGAAFAATATPEADTATRSGIAKSFLHSPWVYGALGVLTVAGAAFLIL